MAEILLPPTYNKNIRGPLIFLAGPIQDAPDWQSDAIRFIQNKDVHIASPRRPTKIWGDLEETEYNAQVEWEHHHLGYAGKYGVVLFWLAKPESHTLGRAYAQTTRFELGWHVARSYLEGVKVVVGMEDGFSNARYIRKTISSLAPSIPICSSLEETCKKALRLVELSKKNLETGR